MSNQQHFLMDDKKLGRLCKVEIYNITRKQKGQNVTKKNYVITIYNKIKVNEDVFDDDGNKSVVQKDKFVKWGEFQFQEAMHPKDRIIQALSKIEMPLSYIPDAELTGELARREIIPLHNLPEDQLVNEIKRRGLTEFANVFKISKNAPRLEKVKAIFKERRKIPDTKLSFEDTVKELKTRKIIVPEDFMTDEELIHEVERRGIPILANRIEESLFESTTVIGQPGSGTDNTGVHMQEPLNPEDQPVELETILGKPDGQ